MGMYCKVSVLETALQARNIQHREVQEIVDGWRQMEIGVMINPRLTKKALGTELLKEAYPTLLKTGTSNGSAVGLDPTEAEGIWSERNDP